jgi:class 3 adenylate cyclase
MDKSTRPPIKSTFILSITIGLLIAFGYIPLQFMTEKILKQFIGISPWEEITATAILGIVYFGLLIYLFVMMVLSFFARRILVYLVEELRFRELLPVKYKTHGKKDFGSSYRDIITLFNSFVYSFLEVKKDKDKYSKTIGTFLDPNVKKEIERRGIHEMYIGGKKIIATVFFSDLRGFTAMTEYYEPDKVIRILNDYLSMATKAINKNEGRVNKYIGDAVMAVFEAPAKYRDFLDADKAIIASLDIQTQFQILMRKWKEEIDPNLNLGLGIGLARGEIIAGNIGSEERMEHTVIGDTVNFASRLCGKAGDGQILIPDDIYKLVDKLVQVDVMPPVEVKGKKGSYNIYSVTNRKMITG